MADLPKYLAALDKVLEATGPPAAVPAASSAPAASAGSAAKKPPAASAALERTARHLEALRVHHAALHVCGTYFFRRVSRIPTRAPRPSHTAGLRSWRKAAGR